MEIEKSPANGGRWYLFLHQVPPAPAYFRARVLRQLNQLGALPIKKSAYLLPANEETFEDLQWLRRSIVSDGGEAWIFHANAVAGHTDDELRQTFLKLRGEDYAALAAEVRALLEEIRLRRGSGAENEGESSADEPSIETRTRKLKRRLDAIQRTDYFGAPQQQEVTALMNEIERTHEDAAQTGESGAPAEYRGRRWVTRRGIKIDRMASAWLIRRFIDPSPEFAFVDSASHSHSARELRFDMFEGEFTHEGPHCTFEVLLERMKLADAGLAALAEIVHDIDLKEPIYRRPETAGVALVVDGILSRHAEDEARLAAGMELFDALYATLGKSPTTRSASRG